jgi:hypothetical protein
MAGFTYKSYSFLEKDPIIDEIRTVILNSGANYAWIENQSGVTAQTLRAWFYGATRKPQAATINAVARSLGYKLGFIELGQDKLAPTQKSGPIHFDPPMPQHEPRSMRHIVQMTKFKRSKASPKLRKGAR